MTFRPYLSFTNNCRQAFTRYEEIFGGELVLLTMGDMPADAGPVPSGAEADLVMHAALMTGDALLMGADDPTGSFGGTVDGICVNCALPDVAEARRVFDALSDGGAIQAPLEATFFAPAFGMCTDRFGVPWMIMVEEPASA
jgi:PhnB protein